MDCDGSKIFFGGWVFGVLCVGDGGGTEFVAGVFVRLGGIEHYRGDFLSKGCQGETVLGCRCPRVS